MKISVAIYAFTPLLLVSSVFRVEAQEIQPPPPQPAFGLAPEEQLRTLLRGPVHEAFAQPFSLDAEPGLEVPNMPPPDLREIPPDVRPTGSGDVQWIPGYWGWDDDRGFVWISGVWRDPPAQMRWVPGYWSRVGPSIRWARGFWVREDTDQIAYLPQPPASRENGPIGEALDENHFWVPGVWLWNGSDFVWRDGFWSQLHPEFVWTPAQYYWSPRGFVFVDGYWDYPPEDRGVLFAPILPPPNPQIVYCPSVVVDVPATIVHFFVRPSYCHYYFGDYYDAPRRGFHAWVSLGWYDPCRVYYRHCRPHVYRTIVHRHEFFVKNRDWRPPHNWRDFGKYQRGIEDRDGTGIHIAAALRDNVKTAKGVGYTEVSKEGRDQHAKAPTFYRDLIAKRENSESKGKQSVERLQLPEALAPDRGPKAKGQTKNEKDDEPKTDGKRKLPAPPLHVLKDRPKTQQPKNDSGPDQPITPPKIDVQPKKETPKKDNDDPDRPKKIVQPKKDDPNPGPPIAVPKKDVQPKKIDPNPAPPVTLPKKDVSPKKVDPNPGPPITVPKKDVQPKKVDSTPKPPRVQPLPPPKKDVQPKKQESKPRPKNTTAFVPSQAQPRIASPGGAFKQPSKSNFVPRHSEPRRQIVNPSPQRNLTPPSRSGGGDARPNRTAPKKRR